MPLAPGTRLGPFEVIGLIGAGGMGEVYRAHDPRLGRDVALKILPQAVTDDPDRRARFEREARSAAALAHPNICTIHEIGAADNRIFIAMELIEGATLSECLAHGPAPMTIPEVLDIGIQIADALNAAREKHLVHRDLKSANIILSARGQVKVLDFGLAKRLSPDPSETATARGVTDAGAVVGTAAFMSPEQALGEAVDHRSDLFSFGVVLYELLTGRLPFNGRSTTAVFDAILHETPLPIPRFNNQAPDALLRIVEKLLEKDPKRRYQSAHDVWVDLRRTRDDLSSGRAPAAPGRDGRRPWLLWTAWSAGATVQIAIAIVLLRSWPARTPDSTAAIAGIVALPSKVFGPEPYQYLTDAIPVTLSTHLAELQGLDTKVPPSAIEVQRLNGDIQQVAKAYGVPYCLVSTVTVASPKLVLNLQVVRADNRSVLWSHEYEGTIDGYLALVKQGADGVRGFARPAAAALPAPAGLAANSAAALALGRGEYFLNRYNNQHEPADFDASLAALQDALKKDPQLADAAANLAFLHLFRLEAGGKVEEFLPQLGYWAHRAIEIDPRSGRGYTALAMETDSEATPNYRAQRAYALSAVKFAPRLSIAHLVLANTSPGLNLTAGLEGAREASRLDPLYLYASLSLASRLELVGRAEEALKETDRILAMEPDMPYALATKIMALADLGRLSEASALLTRLQPIAAAGRLPDQIFQVTAYAVDASNPDAAAAESRLRRVVALFADPTTPGHMFRDLMLNSVPQMTRHGRLQAALQVMEQCRARGFVPDYDWMSLDPRLAPLRSDPAFSRLLDAGRAEFLQTMSDLREARARGDLPKYLESVLDDPRLRK